MIPLYDTIPNPPSFVITKIIVWINVVVFLYEMELGHELQRFFLLYGLVPMRYTSHILAQQFSLVEQIIPFFSSLFVHGGFWHLLGNMWSLWIFGDNVEDRFGHGKFLLFYLLFGLAAGGMHILTNAGSVVPTIGASGAIAGIMGAYLVMFPHAGVIVAVPLIFFIDFWTIPVPFFFLFWFFIQFLYGAMSYAGGGTIGNIAWWAHIGGFVAGMLIGLLFRKPVREKPKKNSFGFEDIEDAVFYE